MQVIITFIPAKTTLDELTRFALSGLGPWFAFWNRSKVRQCDILDIWDAERRTGESHGLVAFSSDEDAEKAIAALNGQALNGKPVEVRRYFNRAPTDQRKKNRVSSDPSLFKDSRRHYLALTKRSEGRDFKKLRQQADRKLHADESIEAPSLLVKSLKPSGEPIRPSGTGYGKPPAEKVVDLTDQLDELEPPVAPPAAVRPGPAADRPPAAKASPITPAETGERVLSLDDDTEKGGNVEEEDLYADYSHKHADFKFTRDDLKLLDLGISEYQKPVLEGRSDDGGTAIELTPEDLAALEASLPDMSAPVIDDENASRTVRRDEMDTDSTGEKK